MNATLESLDKKLDDMQADLKDVHNAIYGPRDLSKPGLAIRLDRLEQIESKRLWHIRALWVALLTLVGKLVTSWH